MPICRVCNTAKSFEEFHKRNTGALRKECKKCKNSYSAAIYLKNMAARRLKNKENYRANKAAYIQRANLRNATLPPEARKQYFREYVQRPARREANRIRQALRNGMLQQATPKWADREAILKVYERAAEQGMQVDHIVPLKSKFVCGLHVAENLQLLSRVDNLKKGNRLWPH